MVFLNDLPLKPPMILLWGSPGVGKTPFVTSYGEGMQFIDCDDGLLSSRTLKDAWTANRGKVDVIRCVEDDPSKALAWEKFRQTLSDISRQCAAKTYKYKVLAIDSFTQISSSCLRAVRFNSGLEGPTITGLAKGMAQQHWGIAIQEIDRMFAYIKALPIPKVVIFHDRNDTIGTAESKVQITELNIFGQNLPKTLQGYFDEIWQQKIRFRSGKMDPYVTVVPDMLMPINRSRGGLEDGFEISRGFKSALGLCGWKEV